MASCLYALVERHTGFGDSTNELRLKLSRHKLNCFGKNNEPKIKLGILGPGGLRNRALVLQIYTGAIVRLYLL